MKYALALTLLFLAACTAPPRQELQSARLAVGRAYYAGAEELAPEEYRQAADTLRKGEELVRRKNFDEARAVLPQAESRARQAMAKARIEKDRLERLRTEEEERRRQAQAAPQPPPPQPLPSPMPAPAPAVRPRPAPGPTPPPAPLPTRYTVGENETLWTIAAREEVYGDPLLWPLLYQANRDQIRDPRRLYRGQVISIPRGLSPGDLEEVREKARRSDIFPISRPPAPRNS